MDARTVAMGLGILGMGTIGGARQDPARDFETIDDFLRLGGRTRVIAHRGFSGLAPENTLAAFERAVTVGADMVELDVLLSREGELVVIHDDTLERTTNGSGLVAEHTMAELRSLDAGSWFAPEFRSQTVPSLEQALRLMRGRILVNVEIKTEAVTDEPEGGVVDAAIALIRALDMTDQVILSSFDPRALSHARELAPEMATASLYNRELHEGLSPLEVMERVGARGFNLSRRQVDEAIVRQCHERERPVAVYTVNEVEDMKRLERLGVHALFTDRPDRLLELLGRVPSG